MGTRSACGHLRETPEEAGYEVVSCVQDVETYDDEDGDEVCEVRKILELLDSEQGVVETYISNPGGVPGYAIVYNGDEYEFVRSERA